MASLNKVTLMGNLGAAVRLSTLPNGTAAASFSIATTRKWKDPQGNTVSDTQWHQIVCYDALANLCARMLEKGSSVYIEGRLQYKKRTDAQGNNFMQTNIVAESFQVLSGGNKMTPPAPQNSAPANTPAQTPEAPMSEDDFPF